MKTVTHAKDIGMTNIVPKSFDYGKLPKEASVEAAAAARDITLRLKRTSEDIIQIGIVLRQVHGLKGMSGKFEEWFTSETGMSRQAAYRFMAVAEKFEHHLDNQRALPAPTVLYALSAKDTPDEAVEEALDLTEAGEKVTVAEVQALKQELALAKDERSKIEENSKRTLAQLRKDKAALETQVKELKDRPIETVVQEVPAKDPTADRKFEVSKLEKEIATLQQREKDLREESKRRYSAAAKLRGMQSGVTTLASNADELLTMIDVLDLDKDAMEMLGKLASSLRSAAAKIDKLKKTLVEGEK